MEEKISIIIPVYNVEKYIRYCLTSVINQTYKNLEIIIVDDGTTDNAGIIADEYAKKDNRINVVHKPNGGLSSARNKGLEIATGKYVTFLDSDDYIHKNYIEELYNLIKGNDADISECEYLRIDIDNVSECENILDKENANKEEKIELYDNRDSLKLLYGPNYNSYMKKVVVCNKLYKTEIFKDITFPEGKLHEDEFTIFKILYKINKIVSTNKSMYGYIQTKNSIMRKSISKKRIEDNLGAYEKGIEFFKDKKEKYIETMAERRYLENCIELSGKIMIEDSEDKKEKLQSIEDLYKIYYIKYISSIKQEAIEEKENRIIEILDRAYKNMEKQILTGTEWKELERLVKQDK